MSASPRVVARARRSAVQTPVLRQGPRVVFAQDFNNGEGKLTVSGGGSVSTEGGALTVTTGTTDTVLETQSLTLLLGVTYTVVIDVAVNEGTITADIDGVTVVPATSATGLVEGTFVATSIFATLTVTASGAEGATITLGSLGVRVQ